MIPRVPASRLRRVKGFTVPPRMMGGEERNHGEIQTRRSKPDRNAVDPGSPAGLGASVRVIEFDVPNSGGRRTRLWLCRVHLRDQQPGLAAAYYTGLQH